MGNTLKAGFVQFNPKLGSQDENMRMLDGLISEGREADLLVMPELANSGYNFQSKEQAHQLSENLNNSQFLEFLMDQASKYRTHLVAGMLEEEAGKLYNTAVLVGPEGYLGKYRKIHLFMNEFDFFEKGNLGLPVFNIGEVTIGILICFDWVFPEVWRIMALKGADIICHPSNLVLPFAQQAVPVHCLINRTFAITANRYGREHELEFSGKSIVSDPLGNTMLNAPSIQDAVQFITMDTELSRNKQITPRNHLFKDRLPGLYGELTEPSS